MKPRKLTCPAELGIYRQCTHQAGETADRSWALHGKRTDLLYAAGMRGAAMPAAAWRRAGPPAAARTSCLQGLSAPAAALSRPWSARSEQFPLRNWALCARALCSGRLLSAHGHGFLGLKQGATDYECPEIFISAAEPDRCLSHQLQLSLQHFEHCLIPETVSGSLIAMAVAAIHSRKMHALALMPTSQS